MFLSLDTYIIGDVEAVANRLVVLNQGQVVADTTLEGLLAGTTIQVWSVTVDTGTALRIQQQYQVSAMVQGAQGVTLRVLSAERPAENALPVEANLEGAYLLAVGAQSVAM